MTHKTGRFDAFKAMTLAVALGEPKPTPMSRKSGSRRSKAANTRAPCGFTRSRPEHSSCEFRDRERQAGDRNDQAGETDR
jgi:hypothetical protein